MLKDCHTQATLDFNPLQIITLMQPPFGNVSVDATGATMTIKYLSSKDEKSSLIQLSLRLRKRFNEISYSQIEDFILNTPNLMEARINDLIREKALHVTALHIKELC